MEGKGETRLLILKSGT